MEFRLIDTGFNTPAMNMAIDEALLQSKLPILRFYRWKPAGLSLGYFQDITDINIKFCKDNNIDVVRRLTGGKTVLHDQELTYSFMIDEKSMPSSIIESYKIISKGILLALKGLGINASIKKEINILKIKKNKIKNNSAVCFNEPSYYEIIANDKKIVGSAQTRKQGKLLQHGAVLIDIDLKKYLSCFNLKNLKEQIKSSENKITSINKELNKEISYETVAKAMEKGFKENFKAKLIKDNLHTNEIALANKLNKKYKSREWNFK